MVYTPPAYAHLPNVTWPDTGTGTASRGDVNSTATTPSETQAQVAAENAPLRIIYGETRIGAQIADALVYQGKLVVVAVWAEGPIESVSEVWMGDAALPANVTATHYLGSDSQTANATLIAAYAANGVTYSDALLNVAYSVIVVPAGDSQGFPTFAAKIKGLKVYDPRTDTTVWSDNPALALADFLASTKYGWARAVDYASVAVVANACDETVSGQKRRLIGLCIDNVGDADKWAETLRTYAGSWITQGANGYKLIPDRPASSVATFTASNIAAGSFKLKKRGRRNIPTVVEVHYTDTGKVPWAEKTATAKMAGVDAGTTPRRESQVGLPGILRYSQAYREAIERLNHFSTEDLAASWDAYDEAIAIEPGDVVTVTHPVGLADKLMRVATIQSKSPGRWTITATEYDPAVYSDSVVSEPTYDDTSLPNPAAPPSLTGMAAVEEVYQVENGTYASRLAVTWDAVDYPFLAYYRIECYQAGSLIHTATTREAVYRSPAVIDALEYVVKVASVTTIGSVGSWAQDNATAAGKYLIPGDVPSIQAFEAGGRVYVSWGAAVDLDIWRYEVRYGSVGGTWAAAKLIDRVDALRLQSDQIPVGTWVIHVKALDSVGQYSTTAATVPVTVTSDASAFMVDSYDSNSPSLTGMASYTINPTDAHVYSVTEDGVAFGTKFSSTLDTYGNTLATYHASQTSTWLGEAEDFGQLLGGQWTGTADVAALSGSLTSCLGFSNDGSAWTYLTGLSQKTNARFARLKHDTTGTDTLKVTVPTQNIRLYAIPREEVGTGTSSASGPVTITLENEYVAVKKLTITPQGTTARSATYDNIVIGSPTTFDVYIFNDAGVNIASAFRYEWQGV